jgi:hypothetical protein
VTSVDEVVLPGAAPRLRSVAGVTHPQDVPLWMTSGGGTVRAAADRVGADAAAVRGAGAVLRSVLLGAAGALGWRGAAASAGQERARGLWGQLALVAGRLEAAQGALSGLAGSLDVQAAVLGSAPSASLTWSAMPVERKTALLARWGPAVATVDAADARAAAAIDEAASGLARVRAAVGRQGWLVEGASPPSASSAGAGDPSLLGQAAGFVGRACAGLVGGLEVTAAAVGEHPEAVVELGLGMVLMQSGVGGELGGLALDSTGVGAVAGVPVGVASAGAIAAGAGLMAMGAAGLGSAAADQGASRASGSGGGGASGGSDGSGRIDIENANYAQRTARWQFSEDGTFSGKTIGDVAEELERGSLTVEDVPVDVIDRNGQTLVLNTRSAQALEEAGIPRSSWRWVDRTGDSDFEDRLTNQLSNNRLEQGVKSVRIKGRGAS